MGVVEDRTDPLQAGRVRVRCFGSHDEDRTILPTDKLPWALAEVKLKEGDWVIGFFLDGEIAQQPCVLMKLNTIPTVVASNISDNIGFHDKGVDKSVRPFPPKNLTYTPGEAVDITEGEADLYPAETEAYLKQSIEEPDTPRVARSDDFGETNTVIEKRKAFKESTTTSANGVTWEEPETPYASVYPHNNVLQSESGHVIEMDDTPGAERLSLQHRSGTFVEIHPNGETVLKFLNNRYTVVSVDDNLVIHGASNITIKKDYNLKIEENRFTEITKDDTMSVDGKSTITIKGDDSRTVTEGNVTLNISKGNKTVTVEKDETRTISGQKTENVSGNSVFTGNVIKLN